jgi:hypothetical protein
MILSIRRTACFLGLAMTTALVGCSSSAEKSSSSPPGSSTSAAPPGGVGSVDAATTQDITSAFKVFFNTDTSLAASVAVLQHGPTFRKTLESESNSPAAKDITATVSKIKLQSTDVALVTFTLKSGAQPLLPNTHGYAVRDGGKWKVAAQTFCSLLQLEGTAPPACKDASITALPD